MGRKEAIYRTGEIERQVTKKKPTENKLSPSITPTEIIFAKFKSTSEKYGYTGQTTRELKKNIDLIRREEPQKMMHSAIELYGERIISSIVAEGDPKNLKLWLDNPDAYPLAGNTDRSLTKIAVSIDFAEKMREKGAEKDSIRDNFIERQPKLGDLSLSTALARIGPEDIGAIHEIALAIAIGNTSKRTDADKKTAKRLAESYILPGTSRGH